jgi:hypothetical protein
MPNTLYLDPSLGTPLVIQAAGGCYQFAGPSPAPPTVTSATAASDCEAAACAAAPCPCPDGLSSTYTLNADGVGPLTLTRVGTSCTWSIVFPGSIEWILTLEGISPNCYWELDVQELGENDASGTVTKSVGSDPTGHYTNFNELNQHNINNAVIS